MGVIDAYATLRTGDVLHAVRASDALGEDRMRPEVGPLRPEVEEPLRRLRLISRDGRLSYDLTWTADGMSGETLLFDIEHPEPPVRACALRLAADPAAYTVFPVYDMVRQYRTMRVVAEFSDLPVPRVLWLEEDPARPGRPSS